MHQSQIPVAIVPAFSAASADSRDFKLPPLGRGHTEGLYLLEVVTGGYQKAIRDSNEQDACETASMLARSGYANHAFELALTYASEDVSIGSPRVFRFVVRMYSAFLAALSAAGIKGSSKACTCRAAIECLIKATMALARAKKSRIVACAAGACLQFAQEKFKDAIKTTSDGGNTFIVLFPILLLLLFVVCLFVLVYAYMSPCLQTISSTQMTRVVLEL
jgi:hypothetical protein